jgi:hypothetical protein
VGAWTPQKRRIQLQEKGEPSSPEPGCTVD